MSLDAVKILGISITINSKNEILEFFQKSLTNGAEKSEKVGEKASFAKKIITIVTPNPEQIVYAGRDSYFRGILNRADVAIPDGIGIVWAIKFLHLLPATHYPQPTIKAIPGIEFMESLVSEAVKQRVPIALIGGRSGLALAAFECLQKMHPKLFGWAVDGPEMKIQNSVLGIKNNDSEVYFQKVAQRIADSGVRIVFVGLGAPKQEYFIEKLVHSLEFTVHCNAKKPVNSEPLTVNPIVFMSVGGSFDEISGRVPRAPQWVSQSGFKWLWRLIFEPWRIRRQLALFKFIFLVFRRRGIII